jgi:iron complex outermembrane receptor protein
MRRTKSAAFMLLALIASSWGSHGSAHAQYGATARVERPIPAGGDLDPTAAATTLETEDRPSGAESLASLLRESPGARALTLGALGSFSTLSLRGAGAEHTRVVFDRMPLGHDGEAFDLSTIPIAILDSVEVYRGGAPIALGTGAIGGVLRLVPRSEEAPFGLARIGYGSFGTRAAQVVGATGERAGGVSVTTAAGVDGTDGDFVYTEDRTPLSAGDEREVTRQNADVNRGYGFGHFAADAGDGRVSGLLFGFGRTGGVAGPAVQPTTYTHRTVARYGGLVGYERPSSEDTPLSVNVSAGTTYERNQFTDRFGEIGLGRTATDDGILVANGLATAELRLAEWVSAAVVGGYRYERFAPEDALSQTSIGPSQRHAGIVAAEGIFRAHAGNARIEVRPSARVEINHARLEEIRMTRAGESTDTTTAAPTLRLGVVAEPIRGLAIVGSLSSGVRMPTLTELFGDRAFLVGDTTLSPESSVGGDLGAMIRGRWGPVAGRIEARGFGLRVTDLIRYRRTSQYQSVPENVSSARVFGMEAGLDLDFFDRVGLAGAMTLIDTTDLELSRDLPLRPTLAAYARPSLALGPWSVVSAFELFIDVTHVGDSFADPANLVVTRGRTRFGAGVGFAFVEGRVRIDATVDDIFDARGQDVMGFPLPGRSFFADLTVRTDAR